MATVTELQKIGVGLTGFGLFFLTFGALLYFDSVLLAFGNRGPLQPSLSFAPLCRAACAVQKTPSRCARNPCCVSGILSARPSDVAYERTQLPKGTFKNWPSTWEKRIFLRFRQATRNVPGDFQVLFLTGLTFIIGLQRTAQFFFQRQKARASAFFLGGVALVLLRWPVVGMVMESYGFMLLFRSFFPVAFAFLGSIIQIPFVNKLLSKLSGSSTSMV